MKVKKKWVFNIQPIFLQEIEQKGNKNTSLEGPKICPQDDVAKQRMRWGKTILKK